MIGPTPQTGRHRYERPAPGHEEEPPVTSSTLADPRPTTLADAPAEAKASPLTKAKAKAKANPGRDVRVPGERGIYVRASRSGEIVYPFVVTDPKSGRNVWRTCSSLDDARAERGSLVGKRHGRQSVTRPARKRFEEYAQEWLADTAPRMRASTVVRDRGDVELHLVPYLGRLYLADIDADAVAKLVATLQREGKVVRKGGKVVRRSGLAAHSVTNALGVLSRIMARAVRAGHVPTNPVALLEASERPKADALPFPELTAADLAAFLAAVRDDGRKRRSLAPYAERDFALVFVTMTTGLRQSEVLGLRWCDVDMTTGTLHVRQAKGRYDDQLKTPAARRSVALAPEALRLLASLSLGMRHTEPDDLVFATADGKALGGRNVLRIVERARAHSGLDAKCEAQGARKLTFHGLRHFYASARIADGHEIADVSRALGHADIATTLRTYTHELDARKRLESEREDVASAFSGLGVTEEVAS